MQRNTVVACVAVCVTTVLPLALVGALSVDLERALHFDVVQLGEAVAGYSLVAGLAAVRVSRLVVRFGAARLLRASGVLTSVVLLVLASLVRSWPGVVVVLAVAGLSTSAVQPSSNVLLLQTVPARWRGRAFGAKQSAIPLGTLLAGAAVPSVAVLFGWRATFAAAGVLGLVLVSLVPKVRPSGEARRTARRPRIVDSRRELRGLAIGFGFAICGTSMLTAFTVLSGVAVGLSTGSAGLVEAVAGGGAVVARLTLGVLADRSRNGSFRYVESMLLLGVAGYGALAVGEVARSAPLFVAGVIVAFSAGWGWNGMFNMCLVQAFHHSPEEATGLTQRAGRLGNMLGPIAFGIIATQASYTMAWCVPLVCALLGAAIIARSERRLTTLQPEDSRGSLGPTTEG